MMAVLFETKTPEGKVNRVGQLVIAGVVASSALGIGTTIFGALVQKEGDQKKEQETEAVLNDVERTLHPIDSAQIFYEFELSSTYRPEYKYVESAISTLSPIVASLGPFEIDNDLKVARAFSPIKVNPDVIGAGGRVEQFRISNTSPLWPNGLNSFLAEYLYDIRPGLWIYRKPIDPNKFVAVLGLQRGSADLILQDMDFKPIDSIELDYGNQTIGEDRTAVIDKDFWYSDGKVASVLDLSGSQIFISPGNFGIDGCTGKEGDFGSNLELKEFQLSLGNGINLWFSRDKMTRTLLPNGCVIYSYVFPSSYSDIISDLSEDDDTSDDN